MTNFDTTSSNTQTNGGGITPLSPNTNPPPSEGGALTYDQVENIWIQAGGSPQAAAMAAAVADAESGLNPNASRVNPDGTTGIGLWLLPQNGMPPGTTDPVANARAALQFSNNGTDWSQWCSTWSDNNCGENNGTYLGSGSNALMSLGQRLTPASYNVIGAAPTGNNAPASSASATSSTSGQATGSGMHNVLLIGALIIGVIVVVMIVRRKSGERPERSSPEAGPEE